MVYTAASPSLAVLEVLVHLDLTPELLPDDYRLLAIQLPDEAPLADLDRSPAELAESMALGDAFLLNDALALRVPSVVVPQERNLLINVRHADMGKVAVIADDPFQFDPRLLSSRAG